MRRFAAVAWVIACSVVYGGISEAGAMKSSEEKATFAGGCFWGVEKVFSEVPGVLSTRVGYTGGTKKDPTYREVCTGLTGHAEAIEITYDPSKTGYPELLEIFFSVHDPTTLNRQGPDIGTQYRSAIFAHSSGQMAAASKAKALLDGSGIFKSKLVTQIAPATEFYPAEDTHQQYLKKNPHGYCSIQFQSKKIQEVLSVGLKN